MYQLSPFDTIIRLEDGAIIPADPANTDFIEYQAWLDAGNTPEPAPVPEPQPDWAGFYDGLLVSGAFGAARAAAASSLMINVAYTDCAASLGLARQGIVNVPAIQASFSALLAMLTGDYALTQEQQDELVGLVESCTLGELLILTFPEENLEPV
jgi:hypothetical protein